jgi:hypothetical protein
MQGTKATGKDILHTLMYVYPDWQYHGLDVIQSREVKGDLILWLCHRRPTFERDFVPPTFEDEEALAWIWEAFRDDHPGRLYEMYATRTWERVKEDLYDELMDACKEKGVYSNAVRH